ncbi:taste receptor, type 2, member 203 [Silurus meridionalis]|nr:taste receptor, type 2, member 203 [Silurus meridionalis]
MVQVIAMENLLFAVVCTPFCVGALVLNVVFVLCLWRPAAGVSIRQPLFLLLAALLGNSTVQQAIALISVALCFSAPPDWLLVANVAIVFQTYCSNFSLNAWISIFYYVKIVPQHSDVFAWIKKNIKAIVYAGFLFDQTLLLAALSIGTASYLTPETRSNETTSLGKTVLNNSLYEAATRMFMMYLICPSCTLAISWGRTFFYLRRHIRRMEQTTGSSGHRQQKNHMRVTVMGIVQTVLFIPTSFYAMTMAVLFSTLYETLDSDKHITITITSISNLANIFCLGFSQNVFRTRVIAWVQRVRRAFGLVET